ncbi:hypothetical protein D3C72_2513010 [compost metagenome]
MNVLPELFSRQRAGEQVALVGLAAMGGQESTLRFGLHALCDHREPENLAQADDRAGDGRIVGIDQHIPDE